MKRLHLFFVMMTITTAIIFFGGCSGRIALRVDVARGIEKLIGVDQVEKAKMGSIVISRDGETGIYPIDGVLVTRDDHYIFTVLTSGLPAGYSISRAEYNFNQKGWLPLKIEYDKFSGCYRARTSSTEYLQKNRHYILQLRGWFRQDFTVINGQAIPLEKKSEWGPYVKTYQLIRR